MTTLVEVESKIQKEFPDYKRVQKSDSFFMKVLGFLLKVITFGKASSFMNDFVTTIRYTVYTPAIWDKISDTSRINILSHERIHMCQCKKYGFLLYSFLYLLFPMPVLFAYYRTKFEKEAYEESMTLTAYYYGVQRLNDFSYRAAMIDNFTGPAYFWMWVGRDNIERWYDQTVNKIRAENAQSLLS